MKTIILDTESNGMKYDQICQLSYIIVEDHELTAKNFFFSVDSMNPYAQKKHGFSKLRLHELSRGRSFKDQYTDFIDDFVDADLICGHNIASDVRLLKLCFGDVGYSLPLCDTFCTMLHFDNATHLKNRTGKHKLPTLGELCRHFRIPEQRIQDFCVFLFGQSAYRAHDARFDTTATYLCIVEGQKRGDLKGVV